MKQRGKRQGREWRRCPTCAGLCYFHDEAWVCNRCGDEFYPDEDHFSIECPGCGLPDGLQHPGWCPHRPPRHHPSPGFVPCQCAERRCKQAAEANWQQAERVGARHDT